MERRAVLVSVGAALSVSGCMDVLTGDEITFEAGAGVVSEEVRSETGYEERRIEEQTVERNFEDVDRTVVIVNVIAEYSRMVGIGPLEGELARFTVLSTPAVEVGPVGPLNPVDDMDNRELAETVQEEYDEIENLEEAGERERTLLEETVTVTTFDAEARALGDETVDVSIHLAQVKHEDDFVVAVGVHPRVLDEEATVDRLLEGVRHPVADAA